MHDERNPPPMSDVEMNNQYNPQGKKPMNKKGDEKLSFTGILEHETARAYLFKGDDWNNAEWLPKSQCDYEVDGGPEGDGVRVVMQIKEWLVEKNGFEGGF